MTPKVRNYLSVLLLSICVVVQNSYSLDAQDNQAQDISLITIDNAAQLNEIDRWSTDGGAINQIVWSSTQDMLAIGHNSITLYNVSTKQSQDLPIDLDFPSIVVDLDFSPTEDNLAFVDSRRLYIWDTLTQEVISAENRYANTVVYNPDGTVIATGTGDAKIYLWDAATLTNMTEFAVEQPNGVSDLVFSPDSHWLLATHVGYYPSLWDFSLLLTSENIATPREILDIGTEIVNQAAFSPDGQTLILSTMSSVDETTLETSVLESTSPNEVRFAREGEPIELAYDVQALTYNLDGTLFVAGDDSGTVYLFDAQTRELLHTIQITDANAESQSAIQSVRFNANGTILAVSTRAGEVSFWGVK
jgi:WD40 repeat protein